MKTFREEKPKIIIPNSYSTAELWEHLRRIDQERVQGSGIYYYTVTTNAGIGYTTETVPYISGTYYPWSDADDTSLN